MFEYRTSDLDALANMENYYQWILHEIRPFLGQRVAEVGAGLGTFTQVLLDNHMTGLTRAHLDVFEPATNLHPSLIATLERRYHAMLEACDLIVHNRSFASGPEEFDTVIMVNVLEHIADDVGFIRTVYEGLAPSGRLIIFVPACPWLYSELDRSVGHYRRYTHEILNVLARESNFEILKMQYMDVLGVVPWYLIHVLGKSTNINPVMAKFYDRFCVPLTRRLERIWAPALGKNLLLVCEKNQTCRNESGTALN